MVSEYLLQLRTQAVKCSHSPKNIWSIHFIIDYLLIIIISIYTPEEEQQILLPADVPPHDLRPCTIRPSLQSTLTQDSGGGSEGSILLHVCSL